MTCQICIEQPGLTQKHLIPRQYNRHTHEHTRPPFNKDTLPRHSRQCHLCQEEARSHLMVAIVADKCFEEGFRPLTWITHPTRQKQPTTRFLGAAYAGALYPGLALTSFHQSVSWPLLLHSGVPPGGGLGYTITASADVNSWASKVMFRSCFISTSILGNLGVQEPQILYFSKVQCKSPRVASWFSL